jgi:hypothetical protein
VDPSGGVVTYRELADRADRFGRGSQEPGLKPGDEKRPCRRAYREVELHRPADPAET